MFGKGLITGMSVTLKHFFGEKQTLCYPEEKLPMSERFRGGHLQLNVKKCISCQLCALSCPNKALTLKVTTDENKKKHMAEYVHNLGRCMMCDLCVERCPAKALSWDKNYERAYFFKDYMTYDAVEEYVPEPVEETPKPEPAESAAPKPAPAAAPAAEAKGGDQA